MDIAACILAFFVGLAIVIAAMEDKWPFNKK